MAIWSSIFGERQLTPPVPAQQISVSELPKELAPYYKDILSKSQALYEQRMAEDPSLRRFTGATLAEFTPEQQQAFTGIAGLVGSQAPAMAEATEMTRAGAAPITGEQIEEYMSPYQQAVTDIEKREATKQFESQVVPELAAKAAQSQAFGGSRQAILEGMAADTQQRLLADIQAKGSAQAYQDAVQRLQEQRTRTGQAASQIGNIGTAAYKGAASELGQLGIVGAAKQQQAQTALDKEYAEWLKQREQPFREMGKYQSMVIGAPMGQTTFEPSKPATFGPSVGQQIVGGLGGLGQLYGQFSGKTLAGTPYQFPPGATGKTGGGISSLVSRKNNAQIGTPEKEFGLLSKNPFENYLLNFAGPYSERYKTAEKDRRELTALTEADYKKEKDYLEAARANRQFEREQALFKSMAKWGMSPEVTGPEGTTAGMQVSQLLSRIGSDVGEAETKARASIQEQDKVVSKLQIKYKEALAKGDMELANTYMAQLTALSGEYAKYLTAQAANLKASGIGDLTPESITDIITKVGAQTSTAFKNLLATGATITGLNPDIVNPFKKDKIGTWTQNEILVWAQDNARQKMNLALAQGKVYANPQIDFENLVTSNIIKLFKNAKPDVLDAAKGDEKNTETSTIITEEDDKGSAKDVILDF